MRRRLILALLCASLAAMPLEGANALDCPGGVCPADAAAGASIDARPIVRIENALAGARNYGSGTLVDAADGGGLILTCAHLFREGTGTVSVQFSDGATCAATLVRIDRDADLAALAIGPCAVTPAVLAREYPRPGESLTSCGYGGDGRLWCNRGRVLGYVAVGRNSRRETLEWTGTARLGDSGGPAFNAQGQLVAVLFGTDGRVVDGTFCGRVRHFLEGLSPRFGAAPVDGEPLAPVPPRERDPRNEKPLPPRVEMPPGADPLDKAGEAIGSVAGTWLSTKFAALLISVGLPAGVAGLAGAGIAWLVMRRGKQRLRSEIERLQTRSGKGTETIAMPADETATPVVERHHNRYVPFEVTQIDKAWSTAHARVGEKYPGAVPYLKIVEGVKNQLLSGIEEPQLS